MTQFRGYIMILCAALFWGLSATAAKSLLNQNIDTILIVQTRVTFTCVLMLGFYLLFRRDILAVSLAEFWRFGLVGVIGIAGANFTYYFTIKESTVATGILIQYTAPLVVLVYGAYSKEEQMTLLKILAAVVSLIGCFLAVGGYDAAVLKMTTIGLVSGLGSVVCFAFLTIYTRKLLARHNIWTVTFYAMVSASLFWLIVNPPWNIAAQSPSGGIWIVLLFLAVVSVLIPHSLFFSGLRYVVPSRAVITSTFEPVVAIISAALVLGEMLEPLQAFGAFLVVTAIVILQIRREAPVAVSVPTGRAEGG